MAELDLDAILAAEDEAAGEPHKVTWGGQTFAVPRIAQWPSEVLDLATSGQVTSALAAIVGDEWDGFYKARRPTVGAVQNLLDGIAQAEGFADLGEVSASSPLLNRATRRSKRTS